MKITVEPEQADKGETRVYDRVFEFAIVGRRMEQGLYEAPFSNVCVHDRCTLIGRLCELLERVRGWSGDKLHPK